MYPLTPLIHQQVTDHLKDIKTIDSLVNLCNSPINLLLPDIALANLEQFYGVLNTHRVTGQVYYAHKANQSKAILRALANHPHGAVDVASVGELEQALAAGFSGERLEATGPKNRAFLRLALLQGVTINVNCASELDTIDELHKQLPTLPPTKIYLRLQSFHNDTVQVIQKDSKFGFSDTELASTLARLTTQTDKYLLIGFSFHLTTTSHQERLLAIDAGFKHTLTALKMGLNPTALNIGGGFGINYLAHKEEWESYVTALKQSLLDPQHESMSWNNSGLGFWAEAGGIRGAATFSDYYRPHTQYQELEALLTATTPHHGPVGQFLTENMLSLHLEPGRSLLDQVGVTVGRVINHNRSLRGELVIFMDMNRSHLNAIELEYMADPIHLPTGPLVKQAGGVYLSGNLCLPHDFLTRRKVFFKNIPQPGDLLAFVNTAGYHMDFTESHTALQNTATKLAYQNNHWCLDDAYQA